jgi:hypothetical protein
MQSNITSMLNLFFTALNQNKDTTIIDFEINKGCTSEEIQHIQSSINLELPEELKQLYYEMNGCKIEWTAKMTQGSLYAYLNIVDIKTAFYGYKNGNVSSTDNAFRDVIWNDSFEIELIKELQLHHLLESFEGRSENTTFKITEKKVQLFDVYEDVITPIKMSLTHYVKGLIKWGGIETLRDEITKNQVIPIEAFNYKSQLFKNTFKSFYEAIKIQEK